MKLEVLQEVRGRLEERGTEAAFVQRGVLAVLRMAEQLTNEELVEVLGESTNLELVLSALERCERVRPVAHQDPLAAARLRGLRLRDTLLDAEGGTLGVDAVARLLRISRQAVAKRRRKGTLLAIKVGRRGDLYPVWQFDLDSDGLLAGLEEILKLLAEQSDWAKLRFFLAENVALEGKRPLDLLRAGVMDPVRRAARLTNEHGLA
ncbi:MAG: hypothetical protein JRH20_16680 [Deltaproteobacteria bacterium]|nr:hypothetical protein [Deltaproteobacteria bacterium]